MIGARAASVAIAVGEGPVTVTEEHRYSSGKPRTAHEVTDRTLRLTESGCGDDNARCDVAYTIRMPEAMSADITAQAGAVKLDGLAGNLRVSTEAGAVEGRGLTSDQVIIEAEAGGTTLEFVEAPTLSQITTTLGGVNLRLPGTTAYAVDVETDVGASSVDVDRDPSIRAQDHRPHRGRRSEDRAPAMTSGADQAPQVRRSHRPVRRCWSDWTPRCSPSPGCRRSGWPTCWSGRASGPGWQLLLLVVFWVLLTYLLLPRLHRILTRIYVPGYFIGRAHTSDGLLGDPINLAFLGDEAQVHVGHEPRGLDTCG